MTIGSSTRLAPAQRATWLLDQLVPGAAASSAARFLTLPDAEASALAGAVVTAAAAHPSLAVACAVIDGEPVAMQASPLQMRHIGATAHPGLLADLADEPFDLATGPLLRAVVFDDGLLLVASGFVADSDSLGVIMGDVQAVLDGREPPPVTDAPSDSEESAQWLLQPQASLPGSLNLPYDAPPPAQATYSGRRFVRSLDDGVIAAADSLADRLGTARAKVFLAAYAALLCRLSSQKAVVIGVPTRRSDARNAVGPWSPVLPLRVDLSGDPSLLEIVASVRDTRSRLEELADVPAQRLVEAARPAGGALAEPLTAALFEDADDGLPGEPVFAGRTSARTDLALVALPTGLGWEHDAVFSDEAATAIAAAFERILTAGLGAPDRPLRSTLSDAERRVTYSARGR